MKYELERDTSGLTARDREAYVLALHGMTMREIAEAMDVHRSRAGQLVKSLVDRGFLARNDAGQITATDREPTGKIVTVQAIRRRHRKASA